MAPGVELISRAGNQPRLLKLDEPSQRRRCWYCCRDTGSAHRNFLLGRVGRIYFQEDVPGRIRKQVLAKIIIPVPPGLKDLPYVVRPIVGPRGTIDLQLKVWGFGIIPDVQLSLTNRGWTQVLLVSGTRILRRSVKYASGKLLRTVFDVTCVHGPHDYAVFWCMVYKKFLEQGLSTPHHPVGENAGMTNFSDQPINSVADGLDRLFDLAESDREALQKLAHVQAHVSRELEVRSSHGTMSDACIVESGLIGSVGFTKEGKRQIIAVFTPGELCNVNSIVAREASTQLIALCASDIRWINGTDLEHLISENATIAKALWRVSALHSAVLKEWVINLGRRFAVERISHLLCEMACRYALSQKKTGLEFVFPVTQEQIADIVGLTAVRVNHSLKGLRASRLATFNRGKVKILDWERLAHKGDFSPHYLPSVESA